MQNYHLAQMNVAKARAAMDDEIMQGFVSRLDEINALADASPGFVWRLQTDAGDATAIQAYDDPNIIVNMSVWEDLDALKHYVYKTVHVELLRDRDAWFDKMREAHQVLWWVPRGHIPAIEEGRQRLQLLREQGPGQQAFTFARAVPATEAVLGITAPC